jgi:hypothetical protein
MSRFPWLLGLGCVAVALGAGCAKVEPPPAAPEAPKPCPRVVDNAYVPKAQIDAPGPAVAEADPTPTAAPAPVKQARAPWKAPPKKKRTPATLATCGTRDNPCPLQHWMRLNMAPALASKDTKLLAAALDKTVSFSPDETSSWASLTMAAADAAKGGDLATARKSCQECHQAFKKVYIEKFRRRPIPQ